jgi:hypothetical protein
MRWYLSADTTLPLHVLDLGKPTPGPAGEIAYEFASQTSSWPVQIGPVYVARVMAVGPEGSAESDISNPFVFTTPNEPPIFKAPTTPSAIMLIGGGTTPPATVALSSGLAGYWTLDETDTGAVERADSLGVTALSENNNPGSTTAGKIQLASTHSCLNSFTATDNANISTGENVSFTWALWYYRSGAGGSNKSTLIQKGSMASTEYQLVVNDTTKALAVCVGNEYAHASCLETTSVVNDGAWTFVVGGYDAETDVLFASLHGEPRVTKPLAAGKADGTATLGIGGCLAGRLDEVAFWKRALSDADIARVYNNGQGLTYPLFQ